VGEEESMPSSDEDLLRILSSDDVLRISSSDDNDNGVNPLSKDMFIQVKSTLTREL